MNCNQVLSTFEKYMNIREGIPSYLKEQEIATHFI